MIYSEKVMEHFEHPHNVGELEDANAIGEVGNARCGDIMKMYMKIDDDGIIQDVKFKTYGCGSAIATSSMATDMVKGKSVTEALSLTNAAVAEALDGLPPVKMHCSVLAEEAIKAALADYYERKGIDPEPILGCDRDCLACGKDYELIKDDIENAVDSAMDN
ncbi:MAG: Fe-S cluster assembly scaffold protein NifU [Coriobacteriales bacterium]